MRQERLVHAQKRRGSVYVDVGVVDGNDEVMEAARDAKQAQGRFEVDAEVRAVPACGWVAAGEVEDAKLQLLRKMREEVGQTGIVEVGSASMLWAHGLQGGGGSNGTAWVSAGFVEARRSFRADVEIDADDDKIVKGEGKGKEVESRIRGRRSSRRLRGTHGPGYNRATPSGSAVLGAYVNDSDAY